MLSKLFCSYCAFRMADYSAFIYIFHACLTLDVSRCYSGIFLFLDFMAFVVDILYTPAVLLASEMLYKWKKEAGWKGREG